MKTKKRGRTGLDVSPRRRGRMTHGTPIAATPTALHADVEALAAADVPHAPVGFA